MKARIIEENCIGCGQCEAVCDKVFRVEDVAKVIVDEIDSKDLDDASMAASGCPTDAIKIEK